MTARRLQSRSSNLVLFIVPPVLFDGSTFAASLDRGSAQRRLAKSLLILESENDPEKTTGLDSEIRYRIAGIPTPSLRGGCTVFEVRGSAVSTISSLIASTER